MYCVFKDLIPSPEQLCETTAVVTLSLKLKDVCLVPATDLRRPLSGPSIKLHEAGNKQIYSVSAALINELPTHESSSCNRQPALVPSRLQPFASPSHQDGGCILSACCRARGLLNTNVCLPSRLLPKRLRCSEGTNQHTDFFIIVCWGRFPRTCQRVIL